MKPRLILVCGLPGAGKTTLSRKLETEMGAICISKDEWMVALGVDLWDEDFRGKLEGVLWQLTKDLLSRGQSVLLEWGFWHREERTSKRDEAHAIGAAVELYYLDIDIDELSRRLESRNTSPEWTFAPITREHLELWQTIFERPDAAELESYDRVEVVADG